MLRINRFLLGIFLLAASEVFPQSLDDADRASFRAGASPAEAEGFDMLPEAFPSGEAGAPDASLSLSGLWMLAPDEGGEADWSRAVEAEVPGSVHAALFKAGLIPDPMAGRNDSVAEACSYKRWWMKRSFDYGKDWENPLLSFEGVANRCEVWLNGHRLGGHEGMFGGPDFPVGKYLKEGRNELAVLLDSIPQMYLGGWPATANEAWKYTTVVNCVYGWHYAKIPSLGIWRDVKIVRQPAARLQNPFVFTKSLQGGMRLWIDGLGEEVRNGKIELLVSPSNFEGRKQAYVWQMPDGFNAAAPLALDFQIENPSLWWPNGMGHPSLYEARIRLWSDGQLADEQETTFGIRTIEMKPLPGGPDSTKYNWTFAINGRPAFVKGTGWCTMDALLDFSRERYERFLRLAKEQHVQLLRAWGGGLPETDDFYALCDELGIMVIQEWPTAWNSHLTQPFPLLEETVERNTVRLRNHPSLVMWGGGNESDNPYGDAIDMMGRLSIELDGTRPFHRTEAWGGSEHNYNCWWDNYHLNHNLNMTADFWGEFGIPSLPCVESVERYLDGEDFSFPPQPGSAFTHHTPIFGTNDEIARLEQYAGYFMPTDSLDALVLGSQLAQVEGVRHTLERARTMWPRTTGALYYKLNDNYPGLSWSSVDYYGAVKPLHYFVRRSFSPVASVLLFGQTNLASQDAALPLYFLDDCLAWKGRDLKVSATVYDDQLEEVTDTVFSLTPSGAVEHLGDLKLSKEETDARLLFFTTEVRDDAGRLLFRNWYMANYETQRGQIMKAARTTVSCKQEGRQVVLSNVGDKPAIGVSIEMPGKSATFYASDNYLWIAPGESVAVQINCDGKVKVNGWNLNK